MFEETIEWVAKKALEGNLNKSQRNNWEKKSKKLPDEFLYEFSEKNPKKL